VKRYTALGLKIEDGQKSVLSGIVAGSQRDIYYHKVKLKVAGDIIDINAGFHDNLPLTGIVGRNGVYSPYESP
jgi:hypothetical protein